MSKAAIFSEVGQPLQLQEFDLPGEPEPGSAICKVTMATVCGSDLYTITGRRTEPTPLILGHEIIGEVVALGDGLSEDGFGQPLRTGDRVSWTIMACCGECFFCTHELPQKCLHLRKYGHMCHHDAPHLTGGFAEHIVLMPGTGIFRIPDGLPDEIAAPANCALATVINAIDTIGLTAGETVLIQGAGLLGLNLIAG
ncbi:MAG: alcohol dehydrogenase catalytic domain-containing protein [Planctomycetota bacterium]|jgi:D-arabinose 1-dehydrogenase-like Zn-dependent alcohol dehydrogenase